jgi:hypothetical protein
MASPGKLVRTVAEVLGLPEATVTVHDRNLVTAGLRTKGGRGTSAAKVTPRDAAHLLVAILGSTQVKDSVEVIRRYTESCPREDPQTKLGFKHFEIPALSALPPNHSLIDAVEALITSAADNSLWTAIWGDVSLFSDDLPWDPPLLQVAVMMPHTGGYIRIASIKRSIKAIVHYRWPDPWDFYTPVFTPEDETKTGEPLNWNYRVSADLEQFRRINTRTIRRIGMALNS